MKRFLLCMGGVICCALVQGATLADSAPVRVRIYSEKSIQSITLVGNTNLRIGGRSMGGPVRLIAKGDQLWVTDEKLVAYFSNKVRVVANKRGWLEVQPDSYPLKRTVGLLEITSTDGYLKIINTLDTENLVLGIIEAELGSVDVTTDSLKAQAVTSRSYVWAMRGRHAAEGYDFCDGPHCQVYAGIGSVQPISKGAVDATRGEHLTYMGNTVPAFFHDSCGGVTSAIEDVWNEPARPYLRKVVDGDDPYCRFAPHAHWSFVVSREVLRKLFVEAHWMSSQDALDTLRVIRSDASGRAQQVLVQSSNPRWVPLREFRQLLNQTYGSEIIPSALFSIVKEKNTFRFTGRGWGHGVGLCQWGAIQMAKEGQSYQMILAHYFPGTQITSPSELAKNKNEVVVALSGRKNHSLR